ncbi:tRNA pseudouridine(55) synthase TruB [Dasania sp. GY-MA-18]|uniref:tRNA pseudouridine synthase B n=1 Tax=Dasania phycosphaerae TaxID=2950436 RepID=A0A9J6RI45_9GAMM|nr:MULTISPECIES: tRNA pseudouridine(55) synthase TruB [Dasania]MCR8921233.1 tRNA pseudouridine(55) synthase TruB [Dasania sp. GY-MA-18]MCZ0863661.1 tRNA pseudouridine(55) synthase TruB [Dasania phycosphaerae]MCZ0867389.1 tRNA pseudouridine(55) synthase TruB [Dasania phycosphaerae]
MARRRRGRPVDGILVLDKPLDKSSNWALQVARAIYQAQKAGHTGSLDPLATGVLPLCFGEATKFSQYLLDSDKAYRSTFTLGVSTATGDAEGEVISTQPAADISEQQVLAALAQFRGEIEQVPSMYSALKHQGQPLYKLARKGIEVERKRRQVEIFTLDLEAYRAGEHPEIDVYIECSKGTYVRSIAEDLGAALGCGAHVSMLRRTAAGPFVESQGVSLAQLQVLRDNEAFADLDALLQPVDQALTHLPSVALSEAAVDYIKQGQAVMVPKAPSDSEFKLYSEQGHFLGIGELNDDGLVKPRRLIATN